ncbi:cytochrome c3 family protein [Ancylomarina longa]|uniref:Uncharacterized protein n=1 Tax=Ancylomarina longa TaxID=2487017 RepID=A0A434AV41_9BACT|nr:cytochrome c3 family protein [Ancylomarina longa]RUT78319.1 hypothetical protein DLK05_08300 [Ancylomarina longa]
MKIKNLFPIMGLVFIASSLSLTSCSNNDDPITPDPDPVPTELAFAGSETCATCHQDKYDMFIESGHPYKLNKVVDGNEPEIPWHDLGYIQLPQGKTWADVTYMIGGYGWKARWLDSNGYIMTDNNSNDDTQFNMADGTQVGYSTSHAMGTKPYDCGKCHTTGWKSTDDGGAHQDGLEGIAGEFFAGGVHCEECHGMGNIHTVTTEESDIHVDKTSELCGRCHTRNADRSIAASGGFIKHHEQYDEWLTSSHNANNVGCIDCHDPHASVKYDDKALGQGVTKACTDCHSTFNADNHGGAQLECITCHMPKASKSAIKTGDYKGDIKTHIFNINAAADGKLFNAEGTVANPEGLGMSLDYVCYQCHKDVNGLGGSQSTKTMEQLSAKATNFHGTK